MNSQNSEIRVRIAPSPTGDWHLGNARTALFTYLFARHTGGKFYLRIEDTDQTRFVEGAVGRLVDILEWLGLSPDPLDTGKPYFVQSQNLPRYQEIAHQLVKDGKAYYCFATPEELETMRGEQQAAKQPPRYDNRWGYRDLPIDEAEARVKQGDRYVIRQKIPQDGTITFTDLVHGNVSVEAKVLDDQVLLKADGFPTYHLAHVVDDHDMQITHVTRGDEWLPSAPRHAALYDLLGWDRPQYAHFPVILGPDKGKLSKRHGAQSVVEYREAGYLPHALLNFLVLLGWSSGDEREFFSLPELEKAFDIGRVHPSPAVFDKDRLDWFNAGYIRKLSVEELKDQLLAYLATGDTVWHNRQIADPDKVLNVVASLHERLVTLGEFADLAHFYYEAPKDYDASVLVGKKQTSEAAKQALQLAHEVLSHVSEWTHDSLEQALRGAADSHGLKAGDLLWPVRAALTGLPASPGVFDVLAVLGQQESLDRITSAVQKL